MPPPRNKLIRHLMDITGLTVHEIDLDDSTTLVRRTMTKLRCGRSLQLTSFDELAKCLHCTKRIRPDDLAQHGLDAEFEGRDLCYVDANAAVDPVDALIHFIGEKSLWPKVKKKLEIHKSTGPQQFVVESMEQNSFEWYDQLVRAASFFEGTCDFEKLGQCIQSVENLIANPRTRKQDSVASVAAKFLKSQSEGETVLFSLVDNDSSDGLQPAVESLLGNAGALKGLINGMRLARQNRKGCFADALTPNHQQVLKQLCEFATWIDLPQKQKQEMLDQIKSKSRSVEAATLDIPLTLLHFVNEFDLSATEPSSDGRERPIHEQMGRQVRHGNANLAETGVLANNCKDLFIRDLAQKLDLPNYMEEPTENLKSTITRRLERWANDEDYPIRVVIFVNHDYRDTVSTLLAELEHAYFVSLPSGTDECFHDVIELRADILSMIKNSGKTGT